MDKERDVTASNIDGDSSNRQVIACKACARAKTKCDRILPTCGRCEAKGIICEERPSKRSNDYDEAFRLARQQLGLSKRPVSIAPLPDAPLPDAPISTDAGDHDETSDKTAPPIDGSFLEGVTRPVMNGGLFASDFDSEGFHDYQSDNWSVASIDTNLTDRTLAPDLLSNLVEEFVDLILEDEWLKNLVEIALKNSNIGEDRFARNFERLLVRFASALKKDAVVKQELDAVRFVEGQRKLIAQNLCNRFNTAEGLEMEERSEVSEESGFHDEDSSYDFPGLDQLQVFITSSTAWSQLRQELDYFVNPSVEARFRQLLENATRGKERMASGDDCKNILAETTAELLLVDPRILEITYEVDEGLSNSVKGLIESWWGERWDWWPLNNYQPSFSADEARLRWTCHCGRERSIEVPVWFAVELENLIQAAVGSQPPSSSKGKGKVPAHPSKAYTPASSSFSSSSRSRVYPSSSSSSPRSTYSTAATSASSQTLDREFHIFYIVKNGRQCKLSQHKFNKDEQGNFSLSNEEFFKWIRSEYLRNRDRSRRWLSIYRYSHCEFYRFLKFRPHKFTLEGEEFPSPEEVEYEFDPKPIRPKPPVGKEEFRDWFYYPDGMLEHSYAANVLAWMSHYIPNGWTVRQTFLPTATGPWASPLPMSDVIKALPKRNSRLDEGVYKRETFWGLYAIEIVAFRYVLAWGCICLLPPLCFVVWGVKKHYEFTFSPITAIVSFTGVVFSIYMGTR